MSIFSRIKKLVASLVLSVTILVSAATAKSPGSNKGDGPKDKPVPVQIDEYPGRTNGKIPGLTVMTADQDEDEIHPSLSLIWHNMQVLKESGTVMGPEIYDFSVDAKVLFCRDTVAGADWDAKKYISQLSPDTAAIVQKALTDLGYTGVSNAPTVATWQDDKGLVTIGPIKDTGFVLIAQAHELIHGIQRTTGVKKTDRAWPIWTYQAALLSYEAAPKAAEKIIAIEMLLADQKKVGPFMHCLAEDKDGMGAASSIFTTAYKNGSSYSEALEKAGSYAFCRQFKAQWWLDAYNETVFYRYFEWALKGELKPQSDKKYSLKKIRKTGYVSEDFNLTAKVDSLPSNLFGSNDAMRQAFDWVNLLHIEKTVGKESAAYKTTLKKLEERANPYLGIDPRILYLTLDASNCTLPLASVLNYYASCNKTAPANDVQHMRVPKYKY